MNAPLAAHLHAEALRREHGLIYGFDTSLSHFGYAVATDFDGPLRFIACGVLTTKAASKKKRASKTDDNRQRFEGLAAALREVVKRHGRPRAICVEAVALPFGKTRLTTVAQLGRARGLVDALAAEHGLEAHEFQAQTLKAAATGMRTADKDTVATSLRLAHPELDELFTALDFRNVEHAADACAAIHAFAEVP